MSLVAAVENGQIVESASQSSLSTSSSSSSDMDKDTFLQLLVAQMQYQDPLEPTSNTEFISQYAQFSQVEQMQNMASSMELQRAGQLVGETVVVKVTSSSGDTNYIEGKVDYVTYENGNAYVSIDGFLYSLDDVYNVADTEYLEAYELAVEWVTTLNQLPSVSNIDLSYADTIDELKETYDNMTDYQKTFIASDKVSDLNDYVERLEAVREAAAALEETESAEETESTEETDADEESDAVEETESAEETDAE